MKKVVVTGATGLVGSPLLAKLKQNNVEVHHVSRSDPHPSVVENNSSAPNVFHHKINLLNNADILDLLKIIRPEYLFHLAWETNHDNYMNNKSNLIWLEKTKLLTNCFYELGGKKLFCAGTCAEYDWNNTDKFVEDDSKLLASNIYTEAKLELLEHIKSVAAAHDSQFVWGRIFFAFGQGEPVTKILPHTINSLLDGSVTVNTNGKQILDFIYAGDIALIIEKSMFTNFQGVINCGSGNKNQLKYFLELIQKNVGGTINYNFNNCPTDIKAVIADTTKIKNLLGENFTFDIDANLLKMIDFYRRRK